MEDAMIRAIKLFKMLELGEIRTVSPLEFSSNGRIAYSALFSIEYCEEAGGQYKAIEIEVRGKEAWCDLGYCVVSKEFKRV